MIKSDTDSVSRSQRRVEDLLSKQKEVNDQLQMAEDDVAQVNDMLSMLHDSKEVRTNKNTQIWTWRENAANFSGQALQSLPAPHLVFKLW